MVRSGSTLLGIATGLAFLAVAPAQAQKQSNTNIGHFYMARQQVEIIDDSPQVQYRTNDGAPGQQGGFPNGPALNQRQALPRAGFNSYTPVMQQAPTNLPRVPNGVPPKLPPAGSMSPLGMRGKAGGLGPGGKAGGKGGSGTKTASKPLPDAGGLKSYNAYKGYGGPTAASQPQLQPTAGSGYGQTTTNTNVQGNVLHWARKNRGGM